MMMKGGIQVAKRDLPKGQRLVNIDTKRPIKEGDIVLKNGDSNQYRLRSVLVNRQKVLIIDIELEDKENPYDLKEVGAESIGCKFV